MDIDWYDIPGYKLLLKSTLMTLKQAKVQQYPESLVKTTLIMIYNEKLLPIFMNIVLRKTNLYDTVGVVHSLSLIRQWFKFVERHFCTLPTSFDFKFFERAIIDVIKYDHALVKSKMIWLLYKSLEIFRTDHKAKIITLLLDTHFNELFYNWSWQVRLLLNHFMFYAVHFTFI